MKINLWCVDQETGERFREADCELAELFYMADEGEREAYERALSDIARDCEAFIGGGAAPLFLVRPAAEVCSEPSAAEAEQMGVSAGTPCSPDIARQP